MKGGVVEGSDSEPILLKLIKAGADIELLELESGKYGKPLVDLIKKSPLICERADEPWEYKNLAQLGSEEFCRGSILHFMDFQKDRIKAHWQNDAAKYFSECVSRWIMYVDEGLRLYVKSDSTYRPATIQDEDYKFVMRLDEEGSILDLCFMEPPSWAQNLYLNSRALHVYSLFFYDHNSEFYEEAKQVRRDAIIKILDSNIENTKLTEQSLTTNRSHVSDRLATLNQAAHRFWSNADRSDRTTHPDNKNVIAWLIERGYSETLADKAATIIRPEWAGTGRKPDK